MLVSFVIDPEALRHSEPAPWHIGDSHKRCIKHGLRYGILVHEGDTLKSSEIWHAVQQLPQQLRTLWLNAFKKLRIRKGPSGWRGLQSVETPDGFRILGQEVQVACLDETRAGVIGLPDDTCGFRILPDGPEVVRMSSIDQASCFREAEALSEEPITAGLSISELWHKRFRQLAVTSGNVKVVDRYAIKNLRFDHNGLARFLKELDGSARRCKVTLLSSDIEECKDFAKEELSAINLSRGGIREIDVYVIRDEAFKYLSHDRFIRFDEGVCEIGVGVEVFGGSSVHRRTSFSFKPRSDDHSAVEKTLTRCPESLFFRITAS